MTKKYRWRTFFKQKLGAIAVGLLPLLIGGWIYLGAPHSLVELIFLMRLKDVANGDKNFVELADLMPSRWETVCESHGYDEPLYLTKYKKKFPTTGALQDGAWSLIFIQDDGTFNQVSSNCSAGILFRFGRDRCLSRDEARLFRTEMAEKSSKCEIFSTANN